MKCLQSKMIISTIAVCTENYMSKEVVFLKQMGMMAIRLI